MTNSLYDQTDHPGKQEKQEMWANIKTKLPGEKKPNVTFHWKSFWIGNAAAILLLFAGIGIFRTAQDLITPQQTQEEQVYQSLTQATNQLRDVAPVLIQQAGERNKNSMESTLSAIEEIDRLINELKNDMLINGITPAKQQNLKRLYATKLDFYKELLLTNEG